MTIAPDRQTLVLYRERVIDEIARALGLSPAGRARRVIGPLFKAPAGRFSGLLARADAAAALSGVLM